MIHRRTLIAAILLAPLAARAEGNPKAPAEALDTGLLDIMRAGRGTPFTQRADILGPIIDQAFDLPAILQNSIGPRYATLSESQQEQLLKVFREFTIASYVSNFDSYSGERFEIAPDVRSVDSEDIVQTQLIPPNGDPTRMDYVVRNVGGAWKIVDVLLDGSISRVAVQRSDFRSLLASGSIEPLIATLRNKVADLSAAGEG